LSSDVPDLPVRISVLAACLALSAFFSAAETVLFSFQPDEVERRRGAAGADGVIAALRDRPRRLLITVLFGNMVVNVLFYSVSFLLFLDLGPTVGRGGVLALSVASLFCVLLFGEVVPKNVAVTFYRPLGRLMAWPLLVLQTVLLPIVWPLERAADAVAAVIGGGVHPLHTEELRLLVSLGAQEGTVEPGLGQMLADVVGLGEVCVSELMVPRVEMHGFDVRRSRSDLLAAFRELRTDVVPAYDGDPEEMLGVLHVKDVLFSRPETSPADVVQPIPYLPETITVERALAQCRREHCKTAFVVDEHGSVVGFVTMEALLEEIVGEIANEYTPEEPPELESLDEGVFRVLGGMNLRDWAEALDVETPSLGVDTVGGLVMALLDRIPVEGDCVRWGAFELTVEAVADRRAVSLIVRQVPGGAAGGGCGA